MGDTRRRGQRFSTLQIVVDREDVRMVVRMVVQRTREAEASQRRGR